VFDPSDPRPALGRRGRHHVTGRAGGWRPGVRRYGWWVGRTLVGVLALLTLFGVGLGWQIKHRADLGLAEHQVSALVAQSTFALSGSGRSVAAAPAGSTTFRLPTATRSSSGAAAPTAYPAYAAQNILLVGSDSRAGTNAAIGGTDASTNNVANSDVVMLAHISADRQHVTVLSIPRDTMVPAPTCRWWNNNTGKYTDRTYVPSPGDRFHFNSGYSVGGPGCVVTEVQNLTGLHIDRFIGIDFAGFQAMVDALGGVTVNICSPIVDAVLKVIVPTGGVQRIDGAQALALVRARHVVGDTGSDLARIRRQQVVLSAILRQVDQAGTLLNPARLDAFLQAFTKNTFTDNVTIDDLVTLAGSLGDLSPGRVNFYTMPNHPSTVTSGGALEVSEPAAGIMFASLAQDRPIPMPNTPTAAAPHPSAAHGTTGGTPTPRVSSPTHAEAPRPTRSTRPIKPAESTIESVNAGNGMCAGPPPGNQ